MNLFVINNQLDVIDILKCKISEISNSFSKLLETKNLCRFLLNNSLKKNRFWQYCCRPKMNNLIELKCLLITVFTLGFYRHNKMLKIILLRETISNDYILREIKKTFDTRNRSYDYQEGENFQLGINHASNRNIHRFL